MVACCRQRVSKQVVIALIFRTYIALYRTGRRIGHALEDEHAGQGVRAIHERGRSLENLYGVHRGSVYFNAVLVSPLLAFLTDAIVHHHHAVITQSADHGLGDAAAGGNGAQTRLGRQRINDIGRSAPHQISGPNHRDRSGCMFDFGIAGQAGYHYFIQFQMPEKEVGGVRQLLCIHCRASTQQCHKYCFIFHSVSMC